MLTAVDAQWLDPLISMGLQNGAILICYLFIWILLQRDTSHFLFGYPEKVGEMLDSFPSFTRLQGNELAHYHTCHSEVTD